MIEIIPAIIPQNFSDLEEKMSAVSGLVTQVQVDVCDGVFVGEKSWPYKKIPDPDLTAILKEEKGFPFWESLDFEVDLMVSNPENIWRDWLIAGANRIIIHFESASNPLSLVKTMRENIPSGESFLHVDIGVALNVDTPNEKIYEIVPEVDLIQFMGIAKIGFQGEPFDNRVLEKISDLRRKFPDVTISVDGGVSKKNAHELISAGAERLVAGSAIFSSENVAEALEELQNLAGGAEVNEEN